jgi:triacylglycerol lipase
MNIILVHGILGFRRKFGVDYFRGVAQHFNRNGLLTSVPELDPTQGVEYRGNQLSEQIQEAFSSKTLDPNQKTHIIAHSMGGLDSRYILSPANPNRIQVPIRSLTTISTPHRGSPIADIIDNPAELSPFPHLPFVSAANLLQPALDVLDISLNGLRNLTTKSCQAFSQNYLNDPNVAYFSTAGSGRPGFPETCAAFQLFYHYIAAATGQPNDGLVTVPSAHLGIFDPATCPGDHAEEVGHNLDNLLVPPAFPYLAKYDQIVANVAAL